RPFSPFCSGGVSSAFPSFSFSPGFYSSFSSWSLMAGDFSFPQTTTATAWPPSAHDQQAGQSSARLR
ncbi:hypothetical protein, partial [Rahnella aceris]|uniref:hypothetical protein n=1 Tax=Rahnella sp. (strain Y9602) TaxID=2703885 RepID=UPI003658B1E3